MSIHYLLDGYNITNQMSALNLEKLEDQRAHLIRFIERYSPQGSSKNHVTDVFDGDVNVFGGMSSPKAKIVFSQGESADDKIKRIVAQAENTKNIIVVSDDRDIQYAVKAQGAKVVDVKAFLKQEKSSKGSAKSGKHIKKIDKDSTNKAKFISKKDAFKITSEFEKIWLEE